VKRDQLSVLGAFFVGGFPGMVYKTLDLSTKNVYKPCLSTFFVSNNKFASEDHLHYSSRENTSSTVWPNTLAIRMASGNDGVYALDSIATIV